jgi:hypothetical protein
MMVALALEVQAQHADKLLCPDPVLSALDG